jgi:hypothetical protein
VHQGNLACRPTKADEANLQPKPKSFGDANGFWGGFFVHSLIVTVNPEALAALYWIQAAIKSF